MIRKILLLAPLLLVAFLLQSYFWVPTYEEQTRGNPDRLRDYISASIGDASLLNPVLSSDSASSEIEGMVYEGLIDRDEELRFRGRVASSWDINEQAFFYVNEDAEVPGAGRAGAEEVAAILRKAKSESAGAAQPLRGSLENIREILILEPTVFEAVRKEGKGPQERAIRFHVRPPARIKLVLENVDQDLFRNLTGVLGEGYFSSFVSEKYVTAGEGSEQLDPARLKALTNEILPAVEHNPVLVFRLRPGVRFHDGQPVSSKDVKFTYESIMNPKNLSPRISDYEPVKSVEAVDPLTVQIVYKRLYSPAFGTWGMGILPEHLLNDQALRKEALSLGKDPEKFSMRDSQFNRRPIGSGPFVFGDWKSDQYIVLKRFEGYWEGPANYERYYYRIVPDLLTQEMEFYAGTVDTYGVQPHQVKRLENDERYQSFSGLTFGYTYIGYNMRRPPFDDRRVRTALGMAVDVDKIIKYVLYGQGERITGPFVKQTDFYNHDVKPVPYNAAGGAQASPGGRLEEEQLRVA